MISRSMMGVGSAFTPLALGSVLAAWYKVAAADLTLDGSEVTQWNDRTSNARHLDTERAPFTYAASSAPMNGMPVVAPNGDAGIRRASSFTVALPLTVYVALAPAEYANGQMSVLLDEGNNNTHPHIRGNGSTLIARAGSVSAAPSGAPTLGTAGIFRAVFTSTAVKASWDDGALQTSAGSFVAGAGGMMVGNTFGADAIDASYGEILVIAADLSSGATHQAVLGYLNSQYAVF